MTAAPPAIRPQPTAPIGRTTALARTARPPTPVPAPRHVPTPQVLRIVRVLLVLLTLAATAIGVASILVGQSHQHAAAAAVLHAQDLRDLRSDVAYTQSNALAALVNPTDSAATASWQAYQVSSADVDQMLLASAVSANAASDMGDVAAAIRSWHNSLAVAHAEALGTGIAPATMGAVLTQYSAAADAVDQALSQTGAELFNGFFETVAIVAAIIAALGFLGALILTARRTHRVINVGVAIGLLAVIGMTSIIGAHAGQSSRISVVDSEISDLSVALTDTWEARSASLASVLQPDQWQTTTAQAQASAADARTRLGSYDGNLLASANGLVDRQQTIASAADLTARTQLVLDATPWNDLGTAIGSAIDDRRPDADALVVPALWYTVALAACCLVAVIATLAGVHTRAKEFS